MMNEQLRNRQKALYTIFLYCVLNGRGNVVVIFSRLTVKKEEQYYILMFIEKIAATRIYQHDCFSKILNMKET